MHLKIEITHKLVFNKNIFNQHVALPILVHLYFYFLTLLSHHFLFYISLVSHKGVITFLWQAFRALYMYLVDNTHEYPFSWGGLGLYTEGLSFDPNSHSSPNITKKRNAFDSLWTLNSSILSEKPGCFCTLKDVAKNDLTFVQYVTKPGKLNQSQIPRYTDAFHEKI